MLPFVRTDIKPDHAAGRATIPDIESQQKPQVLIDLEVGRNPLNQSTGELPAPHNKLLRLRRCEVVRLDIGKWQIPILSPVPDGFRGVFLSSPSGDLAIPFPNQALNRIRASASALL